MTGSREPSTRELQERLERRVLAIEGPEGLERRFNRMGVPSKRLEARYNRHGVPKSATAAKAKAKAGSASLATIQSARKKGGKERGGKQGAGVGAGAGAGAGQNSTQPAAAGNIPGVSVANQPTDNDSLGLDIE